jgi:cobalt/nickel transport protein
MKIILSSILFITTVLNAHFQVIKPKSDVVTSTKAQKIELSFMHPFELEYMQMEKPNSFGYFLDAKKVDLTDGLIGVKKDGFQAWSYDYKFKNIGNYIFFVDPVPYFEPSEGKFIRHLTKTIVDAHNAGEGWDSKIGLKAEIVPLARPYGLYSGNIFSGSVLYRGQPVAYAEIEVEFYNDKGIIAPTNNHITQVIKADKNGVFHYAMPFKGWWGFAALMDDDVKIERKGREYPVELGALIWIKAH